MAVSATFRRFVANVQQGEPGHRFQDRYHHAAEEREGRSPWKRFVKIGVGVAAIAVGLLEVVFPGPAILFFAFGGALLASESLLIARAMDWSELRVREALAAAKRFWRGASTAVRVLVVAGAVLAAAVGALLLYRMIFR